MKLSIQIIARQMQRYKPKAHLRNDARRIEHIKMGEMTECSSVDTVYISYDYAANHVICNCLDGCLLFEEVTLDEIFNEILRLYFFYSQWENSLITALYENVPWQRIVNLMEEIFAQPMFLLNYPGEVVGITKQYEKTPITVEWLRIADEGMITLETCNLGSLNELKRKPTIVDPPEPFIDYLQFGIFRQDLYAYSVYIPEWNRKLEQADIQLAEAVQDIASTINYKNKFGSTPFEQFFTDILNGHVPKPESAQWILQQIKRTKNDLFQVASIQGDFINIRKNILLLDLLKRSFPDISCFHWKEDTIVLLFFTRQWQNIHLRLKDYLQSYDQWSGISMAFQNLENLQTYFNQAYTCMKFGISMKQYRITLFWEHRLDITLNSCYQIFLSTEIFSPAFRTLLQYDEKHDTQFTETLYTYIRQERNVTQTAELLYLHRNTLSKKLERIKQICPIDMDNYKERLCFLLSYDAWVINIYTGGKME